VSDKEKIKAAVSKLRKRDPRVIAIRNMIALAKAKGTPGEKGLNGLDGMRGADGINGINGIDGMRGADGLHGAKGLDGSKGEIGAVGPQGDKGEAGMVWRGTYRSDIEYDIGDVVGVNGSAYVCVAATNQAPPVGFGWELLVSRGAQGIRGIKGEDGVGGGGAAAAGTLTGTTLATNVTQSSLTQVGTLEFLTVTNTIGGSISGNAATATSANSALTANTATTATSALTAGTVTTAAQPTITSVGTLTSLTTSGVITGTNTTAASSSTTGAIIIAGGAGIAKDSYINSQRIGVGLLQDTTNLGVGVNALNATITGGINNTAIGSGCGANITSGSQNTFLGYAVGTLVNTGAGNCSIGYASLNQNQSGSYNTAMGYGALQNTTAGNNTAVGLSALGNISTGGLNTAVGREAGCFQADGTTALTTANNSIYIGRDTRGTQTDSNSVVIGYQAIGIGANTTVIGTSSTTATKVFGTLQLDATALISSTSATALAIKSAVPAGTGVTPTIQVICPSAANSLSDVATAQNVFSPTGFDTITVQAATTYMFDGLYICKTGTTSHFISMNFALTTATITNMTWFVLGTANNGSGSQNTSQTTTFYSSNSGGQIIGASTNSYTLIKFEGIMRVNAAGSVVPQITFSAAPGGTNTLEIGSYLRFYPIGSNTIDTVGTAIG
jgi:hypothetical protein